MKGKMDPSLKCILTNCTPIPDLQNLDTRPPKSGIDKQQHLPGL